MNVVSGSLGKSGQCNRIVQKLRANIRLQSEYDLKALTLSKKTAAYADITVIESCP